MNEARFLTGIFSVYDSEQALHFTDSESYPLGLELIFNNDATGKAFAQRLDGVFASLPAEKATLYQKQGGGSDPVCAYDCFFGDTDTLRRALAESLDGIGMYHQEAQKVIPRTALVDEARTIMAQRRQTVML